MKHLLRSTVVGAALLAAQGTMAHAADLSGHCGKPCIPVEPVPVPVPVAIEAQGGVYLRGYVGVTNQEIDTFTNDTIEAGIFTIEHHNFDSSPFIGFGLGFSRDERFRFDVTGEYRGKSNFRGLDTYVDPFCGPGVCTNEHTGIKKEWLFLANAYWDITTWRGLTPYVGGGVGFANIELENFWDRNLVTNGLWWAKENDKWNFAWALHAGLAYDVSRNLTLDIGYRYVDMGDAATANYYTYDPAVQQPLGPTTLKDVVSHDVMVGMRWNFGHEEVVAAAPPIPYK